MKPLQLHVSSRLDLGGQIGDELRLKFNRPVSDNEQASIFQAIKDLFQDNPREPACGFGPCLVVNGEEFHDPHCPSLRRLQARSARASNE